jgi:hypothetical protein
MYADAMKRLQILIDEELDVALERKARQDGKSKAALIRKYVRDRLRGLPPLEADPLWQMAGADSFDPVPTRVSELYRQAYSKCGELGSKFARWESQGTWPAK